MSLSILEKEIADKNWNCRLTTSGLGTIYQGEKPIDYWIIKK